MTSKSHRGHGFGTAPVFLAAISTILGNGEDILVIQSLLGHASPRSTRIYIHPSQQRIREALEKLPGVIYLNQLLGAGVLNLNFQPKYRQRE